MALSAGTAFITVLPNMKAFAASMTKGVSKAQQETASKIGKTGLVLGAAVLLGAKTAIDAASDLNEAQSAVAVTFGKSAGRVIQWSKDTNDAFSQLEFDSAIKGFAVFAKTAKLSDKETATWTKGLVDAAGDLASFHNADPSEVLDNIKSGLTGEAEPLRKYGILINEAAVNQEAWSSGIAKQGKPLTEQQKILARRNLIIKNLGAAEGDWARTSDSAANVQRNMKANAADLQAQLGQGLLPVYQDLLGILVNVVGWMAKNEGIVKAVAAAVAVAAAAFLIYSGTVKVVTAAQKLLNGTMALNPIGLVVVAVIALVAALIIAYKRSETFRNIVNGAFNKVKTVVGAVVGFIREHWRSLVKVLLAPVAPLVLVVQHFGDIRRAVSATKDWIVDKFNAVVGFFRGMPRRITAAAGGMWNGIKDAFRSTINTIIRWWNNLSLTLPSVDTHIPGIGKVGGFTIGTPDISELARGGTLLPGAWAIAGEAGPELLHATSRGTNVIPLGAGTAGGMALTITNWEDGVGFITAVADESVAAQGRHVRQRGRMNR